MIPVVRRLTPVSCVSVRQQSDRSSVHADGGEAVAQYDQPKGAGAQGFGGWYAGLRCCRKAAVGQQAHILWTVYQPGKGENRNSQRQHPEGDQSPARRIRAPLCEMH